MPLDSLPGSIDVPDRDAVRDEWLADFTFWGPAGVDTSPDTLPFIDASVFADMTQPLWAAAVTAGNNLVLTEATGAALEAWAAAKGLSPTRIPATGATGFLAANVSTGGCAYVAGDEARTKDGMRFTVTTSGLYLPGSLIPMIATDTGPGTNIDAGTVLTWTVLRPGSATTATVYEQADGSGFSGGQNQETDDELRARIIDASANPAASGNDAEYQAAAEAVKGLSIQKAFTYPAVYGPGTIALVFTLQPDPTSGSRVPNTAQINAVQAALQNAFPADDGLFVSALVASPVDVVLEVDWAAGAAGWADVTPWPPYYSGGGAIVVTSVTDETHFSLNGTTTVQPQEGQTIGFYDSTTGTFYRKQIAKGGISGAGPWAITCDTTNNASDTTYKPVVGQRAMPWSDSLQSLVQPVADHFKTLGPGEQFSSFFDVGNRQRRSPAPPAWPDTIGNRLIVGVIEAPSVGDAAMLEPSIPRVTPTGTPGVQSYLLTLGRVSAFPE